MARKPEPERMQAVYQTVEDWPGERPGFIARLLGLHRSSVTRLIPSMEQQGYHFYEDQRGGLWPFRKPEKP